MVIASENHVVIRCSLEFRKGVEKRGLEKNPAKISGTTPIEISMDAFSESRETRDYLYTNAALAAGLPNVSRLTQEQITGRTIDPIYLNRIQWTASDAGSRIGLQRTDRRGHTACGALRLGREWAAQTA